MEHVALSQHDTKEPPRFVTIFLLALEFFFISWVSILLMRLAPQFMPLFNELEIELPFITIALMKYWYLWIILLFSLLIAGILIEIFVKGKWRWINIILSSATILLSWLIAFGFIFAVFEPLVTLIKELGNNH
jgi:hypothetical protein